MAEQVFYPKEAGFTKAQVIEMINERREDTDEFKGLREPDLNKLTDERMQKFVDDWHAEVDNAFDFEYNNMGDICVEQEKHLEELAKEIQADA